MNKKILLIVSIIFAILLFGTIIGFGIYYSFKDPTTIIPNTYSQNRLTNLHRVLSSHFGPKWPIVFIMFGILFLVILVLLYLLSKENIELPINDNNYRKWSIFVFWFGILFTITIIIFGILAYIKWHKEQSNKDQQAGDFSNYTQAKQLIQIIMLSVLLIIIISFITWFVIKKLKNKNKLN